MIVLLVKFFIFVIFMCFILFFEIVERILLVEDNVGDVGFFCWINVLVGFVESEVEFGLLFELEMKFVGNFCLLCLCL